jgi:2-oxoisovalerate dehydrogenase E1 component
MCLEAAEMLEKEDYHAEVIDLRTLVPFDRDTLLNSIKKTNRALIVHEDKVHGGFGGEISSFLMEEAFEWLDAPVKRLGSTFTPVGFHRELEKAILPNTEKIYQAAMQLLQY